MAFVHEIQIKTAGFPGAPGFTNLYFTAAVAGEHDTQFSAARAFVEGIAGLFPPAWSAQINPVGRLLEETTGALGTFTTAPSEATGVRNGSVVGGFGAGVAGAVIGWSTATVNRSRLVRGRTFLVPLSNACYDADGTLLFDRLGDMNLAAQNLISANVGFCIWSRPRAGTGGLGCPVVTRRVNDKVAFLSSRRD